MDCSHQRVFSTGVHDTSTHPRTDRNIYGPYTDTGSARAVLDLIRGALSLAVMQGSNYSEGVASGKYRLCLDYHISAAADPAWDMSMKSPIDVI